ncbi:hypothetical protein BKA62DRAFT_759750, partial [Auriculariales sp. MPI-PUGE-AT-0066]
MSLQRLESLRLEDQWRCLRRYSASKMLRPARLGWIGTGTQGVQTVMTKTHLQGIQDVWACQSDSSEGSTLADHLRVQGRSVEGWSSVAFGSPGAKSGSRTRIRTWRKGMPEIDASLLLCNASSIVRAFSDHTSFFDHHHYPSTNTMASMVATMAPHAHVPMAAKPAQQQQQQPSTPSPRRALPPHLGSLPQIPPILTRSGSSIPMIGSPRLRLAPTVVRRPETLPLGRMPSLATIMQQNSTQSQGGTPSASTSPAPVRPKASARSSLRVMPRLPMLGDERGGVPEPTAVHEIEMEDDEDGQETMEDDDDGLFSESAAPLFAASPRTGAMLLSVDSDGEDSELGHGQPMQSQSRRRRQDRHDQFAPKKIEIRLRPTPTPAPALGTSCSPVDYFSQQRKRTDSQEQDQEQDQHTPMYTPTPSRMHQQQPDALKTPRGTPAPAPVGTDAGRPTFARQRSRSMVGFTPGGGSLRWDGGEDATAAILNPASSAVASNVTATAVDASRLQVERPDMISSNSSLVPLGVLQEQLLARRQLEQRSLSPSRLTSQPPPPPPHTDAEADEL